MTCQLGTFGFEDGTLDGFVAAGAGVAAPTVGTGANPLAHSGTKYLSQGGSDILGVMQATCPQGSWFQPLSKTMQGWYKLTGPAITGSVLVFSVVTPSGTIATPLTPVFNTWTMFSVPVSTGPPIVQVISFAFVFNPMTTWNGTLSIDDFTWVWSN